MKRILSGVLICILAITFVYSAYNLLDYWVERKKSDRVTQNMMEQAVEFVDQNVGQTEETPSVTVATKGTEDNETIPEEIVLDEYPPLSVDFEVLKQENEDIIAWIYCEDTPINYPIVQSEDNNYYLYRLPDKRGNAGGSIFLDYRSEPDFSDFNSVLHGHNMNNGSMFGSIMNYKREKYYAEHPVMYLLTPEQNYKVEILVGFVTATDSYAYSFSNDEESRQGLIEEMTEADFYGTGDFTASDRYLTLSTCAYDFDNAKYILIGKLVKIRTREAG